MGEEQVRRNLLMHGCGVLGWRNAQMIHVAKLRRLIVAAIVLAVFSMLPGMAISTIALAAAQESRSFRVFVGVTSRPSKFFKSNLAGEFYITPPHPYDKTPYHVQTPFTTLLKRTENEKIILAGNGSGTAGWQVDNFLFVEILAGTKEDRFYLGGVNRVEYQGQIIRSLGGGFQHGPFDLTPFIPAGVSTRINIYALDFGVIGYVSDLFLAIQSDKPPGSNLGKPKLAFLRIVGSGLVSVGPKGIQYGDLFRVEAQFDAAHDESTVNIDLEWDGGASLLPTRLFRKKGTGCIYLSRPLRMVYDGAPKLIEIR
jgi:hypothetical protein